MRPVQRALDWLTGSRDDDVTSWYWPPPAKARSCARAYKRKLETRLGPQPALRDTLMERENSSRSSSTLLQLPPEIRILIWQYAVGGQRIALYRKHGRLTHCLLDERNSRTPGTLCNISPDSVRPQVCQIHGRLSQRDFLKGPPRPPFKAQLLALLKTCRLIYVETIDLLYSENTFILLQNMTVQDLYSTTLPQRFAAIRSLHIHFQIRQLANVAGDAGQPRPWRERDFAFKLDNLHYLRPLEHLSIFIQGPLMKHRTYKVVLSVVKAASAFVTKSCTVRLPWPTRDPYESDFDNDSEREDINKLLADSPLHIIRTPWDPDTEMADLDTGYDVGWRVGAMFFPGQNGSSEVEVTSYAVFTPLPK